MANDESRHVALPKLYGAPAYARPPVAPVAPVDRPFDPDELPLESAQTDEERQLIQELFARPYEGAPPAQPLPTMDGSRTPGSRPFRLPSVTGLLRGGTSGAGTLAAAGSVAEAGTVAEAAGAIMDGADAAADAITDGAFEEMGEPADEDEAADPEEATAPDEATG